MDISLVIPAYNEEDRLPPTIRSVLGYMDSISGETELILVDDGSTDGTRKIIESEADGDGRIKPVTFDVNRGKGAAVRGGMLRARGRVVIFFDADLSYPLETIEKAAEHIDAGADMVLGARDLAEEDSRRRYSWFRRAATTVLSGLVEQLLSLGIPDTQCGFKAFRREVARALFEQITVESFSFDIELLFLARFWSLRIERIPVEMIHAHGSTIMLARDSLRMLLDIVNIHRKARAGFYPPRPGGLR